MITTKTDDKVALSHLARKAKMALLMKAELKLEAECVSIQDRINDLQWRIEGADDFAIEGLMNERQRALDKLRETRREMYIVKEQIIDAGE